MLWWQLSQQAEVVEALPLNDYDRQTLARMNIGELPAMLGGLAEAMQRHGVKAEQEGCL